MTRVDDRNTADMAAQFTQIATTSKRTPNNLYTRQSEVILEFPRRKSSSTVLLKTVDLCLEMSSDFKNKFCFVVEQIFELRNTAKSRCLGVRVEAHANLNGKSLGSIRGRQTTVDALIGN